MDRAVQKARAGFADFLKKFAAPPAGTHDFTVKVDLAGGIGASEAVWLKPFVVRGRDVVGAIANTPEIRTEFKQGQVIAVARADVLDWSYREGEKRRGNFTACALLAHEPAAERDATIRNLGLDC